MLIIRSDSQAIDALLKHSSRDDMKRAIRAIARERDEFHTASRILLLIAVIELGAIVYMGLELWP